MKIESIVVGPLQVNCYVVSEGTKAFIVDPGDDADEIKQYLSKNHLSAEFVIYTHGHGDHIYGGISFKDTPMYIHRDDEPCLYNAAYNLSFYSGTEFAFPHDQYRVNQISDGDVIEFSGHKIQVLHTPGHTKGGVCLLLEKNLFSGDTLFSKSIGRTDLYGGNYAQLVSAIKEKIFTLNDDVKVFPGHGKSSSVGEEKRLNPFFYEE